MSKKGILKGITICALATAVLAGAYSAFLVPELIYNSNNEIFKKEKVYEDLEYYGGSKLYTAEANSYTLINNRLVKHFDTGHNDNIVVGYDSKITEEQVYNFDKFIDYLNEVFSVINPNYKFSSCRTTEENSDIFITSTPIDRAGANIVGMQTTFYADNLNRSIIKNATINLNEDTELNHVELRFTLAHEFFHILTGALDLNITDENYYNNTYPMSVFDYKTSWHIMHDIYYSYDPDEESSLSDLILPIDREIKENWVSYMPFDLSALIAIYGDSSNEENRQSYLKLLSDTYNECHSILTDRKAPYFLDGYTLPLPQGEVNEENYSLYDNITTVEDSLYYLSDDKVK